MTTTTRRKMYAWLDSGGSLWVRHTCRTGKVVENLLPHDAWQIIAGDQVVPAVVCQSCGTRDYPIIEEAPTP